MVMISALVYVRAYEKTSCKGRLEASGCLFGKEVIDNRPSCEGFWDE